VFELYGHPGILVRISLESVGFLSCTRFC